jgi:hypothetical protein
MVCVGCRSSDYCAQQISRYNKVGVGTAHTFFRLAERIDSTRPLEAVAATNSQLTETALRFLFFISVPSSLDFFAFGFLQHFHYSWVNCAIMGAIFVITHFL